MFNPIYFPILWICKSSTLLSIFHYTSTLHYYLISCYNISSSLKFPSTTLFCTPVSLLYSIKLIKSKLIQSNQFSSNQIKINEIILSQIISWLSFFLSPFLFFSPLSSNLFLFSFPSSHLSLPWFQCGSLNSFRQQ